jgi:UDP-perosamine 4-acetyltransferase
MSARPVIVLGAGGHAKVVIDLLHKLGRNVVAAVGRTESGAGQVVLGVPVMSGDDAVMAHDPGTVELALGIGMPTQQPIAGLRVRCDEAKRFESKGYSFPFLIHPNSTIGEGVTLGRGAQVMAGAVVQPDVSIGEFAIINTGARIDHDCWIGAGSQVGPGAVLGGAVRVGSDTLIGMGSVVRQGITIGSRALLGAGAVAVADMADGARRIGTPARDFKP